jgi:bile acid:Na+ symporter, BASS family
MKIVQFIEKYFWIFLIAGLVLGLLFPFYNNLLMRLLKPLLMIMLFLVFLKTDLIHILKEIKDYRLMAFLVFMFMLVIPVIFFLGINLFDRELAIGILLLTAMPAGVSSPTLTDIVNGNTALALSITIVTSMVAPFTVPLLFRFINIDTLSIDIFQIFKDLSILVFVPLILSQIFKKYFPERINKGKHIFTSVNIIVLFIIVYASIGSQHNVILSNFTDILWKTGFLYLVFILLHIVGYLMGYNQNKENKVAITIGAAYMNNGMAVVLAALYFEPPILVLVVLSEVPWNTLLGPFKKILKYTS